MWEGERDQIVDHGDLGHAATQHALGERVEQRPGSVQAHPGSQHGLTPKEPRHVAPDAQLWPRDRRDPSHRRPQTGERPRARSVDYEAFAERIESPEEAQGVLPEPGRGRAEDRRVDGEGSHRRTIVLSARQNRSRMSARMMDG